ncbi:APC family permease [Afifella sp. JA880]|uniref:APC family permease n=1 Tax=Afifella sp. JA880 TaxID=2975280 RepID=UPI0021BB1856|nr:APC family permease [Afifella sp. JA880]MCT8267523.1 APC family permease [Afifella sp. JA880]
MAQKSEKLSLVEVTALGIGGMIGGGIFAVLGLAMATAGHAVALTLAGGGAIALLTGLSYARLGLTFRDDGGSFTYIEKAFAAPAIAGVAGWLLVAGYVGTLALYASAFGEYGASLLPKTIDPAWAPGALGAFVLGLFLAINLVGAKISGGVELGVVAIKLAILALFAAVAMGGIKADHFVPVFNLGITAPIAAIALIFVAYEGFELIPNAVDEMANPERNLPRAIVIAILVTTAIYVVVAIAALGNLTPQEIQKDQEYVLAVAARPTLGAAGFTLIGIAALLSTASAINATLFGAARLAMVMAREHALPKIFSMRERTRPVPFVSLIVLTVLAIAFTLAAPLQVISTFASATFLVIFTAVNLAAFRLAWRIKMSPLLPLTGSVLAAASFAVLMWHTWQEDKVSLAWLAGAYGTAILVETALIWRRGPRRHTGSQGETKA